MASTKRGPKGPLTAAHKEALAIGREEGRAVRRYLEALRANRPARGRKRTSDTVSKRLSVIQAQREQPPLDPITELRLIQEQLDLTAQQASMRSQPDLVAAQEAFEKVAKAYSERTGVSYTAWRSVGVPAAVLKAAGIK